jgi:regulatory protein
LFQKLRAREFPEAEIRIVLANLAEENLLSNRRFAENYIHFRRAKGYGPMRIRAELMERGIVEEFIEHLLNISDNAWFIDIHKVWQKRFKGQQPDDFKNRAQQMRFLQYRGFTQEQIESIFK